MRVVRRQVERLRLLAWHARRIRATTWSGTYPDHAAVPTRGPGYRGAVWIEGTARTTRAMLRSTRLRESVSLGRLGEHALLPLLAATLGTERVRVLDFGGGMGIGYATMRATLPETVHVSYRIIEIPPVCERGRSLYLHGEDVSFLEHLPGSTSAVDIVYSRSALQYVSAYRSVLRTLLGYRARYALFVMLPAGDIPTYASAQTNVPGSILAHWFFNIDEILQIASECGYALAMRAPSDRAMDRSDVPASHRLARASNLLFARRVL